MSHPVHVKIVFQRTLKGAATGLYQYFSAP